MAHAGALEGLLEDEAESENTVKAPQQPRVAKVGLTSQSFLCSSQLPRLSRSYGK